jgi:hypothetical protein
MKAPVGALIILNIFDQLALDLDLHLDALHQQSVRRDDSVI